MSREKHRKEEQKAIRHLTAYLDGDAEWSSRMNDFLDQMIDPIADQLDISIDEAARLLLDGPYASMAYGYLFDEFVGTRWNNEPDSLIDTYLQRRGWREAPAGRRYLTKLNNADAGLYEVVQTDPGKSVTLKPHGGSARLLDVSDQSASESLTKWDCVAGRVLKLHGRYEFAGGLLMLPPDQAKIVERVMEQTAEDLNEVMQEALSSGELDLSPEQVFEQVQEEVSMCLPEIVFRVWGVFIIGQVAGERPELRNFDGDLFEIIRVRFKIVGSKRKIRKALDNEPVFEANSATLWSWLPVSTDETAHDSPSTLLGQIELSKNHVELQVNSKERAAEGQLLLETLLSGLVGAPLTLHESLDSVLARHEIDAFEEDALPPPEMQEISNRLMDDHYRKTLDEPIPMLGNKSPRECAADPELRSRVVGWLKFLENTADSHDSSYDMSWMWVELSLSPDDDC